MTSRRASCIALLASIALWPPGIAYAGCNLPLPTPALQALDDRVDADPAGVIAEIQRRLAGAAGSDALSLAELHAIRADAYSLLDDDDGVRAAVVAAREQLEHAPASAATRTLGVRLDIVEADSPRNRTEMAAWVARLTQIDEALGADSLQRVCLLMVRSRLNTQLVRDEEATADGLAAYRLATALRAPGAVADAAYQLAMTYLRAGLLDDAERLADEAADYNRAHDYPARLSNALYIKADVLEQMHRYDAALATLAEARALNERLNEAVDVGFDDQKTCSVLLALKRLDEAERACTGAQSVLRAAGRTDLVAVIDGSLARIDLARGNPGAAVTRLTRTLSKDRDTIPARTLPKLLQIRSDALSRMGRAQEALRDLQETARLVEAADAERHGLTAAHLKERATIEAVTAEKRAVEMRLQVQRQEAKDQQQALRLRLWLALTVSALLVVVSYLLWAWVRQERARRHAAETLEMQARVLSTVREGVLLINDSGRVEYANDAAVALFGRSRQELSGALATSLGIDSAFLADRDAAAATAAPRNGREFTVTTPDGRSVTVLLTRATVLLGHRRLSICVLQDVTELRQLENRLLSSVSRDRVQSSSDVHEGLAQDLAGISLLLRSAAHAPGEAGSELLQIEEMISRAIARAREIAEGLSAVQAAGGSLELALSRYAADVGAHGGPQVACSCDLADHALSPTAADRVFRVAQECVTLLATFTASRAIELSIESTSEALELVADGDGALSVADRRDYERGVNAILYLVHALGGSAEFETSRRTRVSLTVPWSAMESAAPAPAAAD